jgi:hypothetical protein
VVGGGPELAAKDTTRFPTVVEGFVDDSGRLRLKVHDLQSKAVVFDALV